MTFEAVTTAAAAAVAAAEEEAPIGVDDGMAEEEGTCDAQVESRDGWDC